MGNGALAQPGSLGMKVIESVQEPPAAIAALTAQPPGFAGGRSANSPWAESIWGSAVRELSSLKVSVTDAQRFDIATRGMVGKRLTLAELTGKTMAAQA
jgi:hypothetical protein